MATSVAYIKAEKLAIRIYVKEALRMAAGMNASAKVCAKIKKERARARPQVAWNVMRVFESWMREDIERVDLSAIMR